MASDMIGMEEFRGILDRKRGERSIKEFAPTLGVSFQFLAKVVKGDYTQPGPKLAAALGYEQVVMLRRLPRKRGRK